MTLPEDQRADGQRLAHGGLRRVAAAFDDGGHVHDGDSSDHGPNIPCMRPVETPSVHPRSLANIGSFKSICITVLRVRAIRRFTVRPVLPEPLQALGELAGNLRWSWHPETQDLFASVDPEAWEAVGPRPGAAPRRRPAAPGWTSWPPTQDFLGRLAPARADLEQLPDRRPLVPAHAPREAPAARARSRYFSPEFGITAVLPQYSGGLGILAGDHLKAASDLGVPIIGVGLLYRHGYFRQSLSRDGWQQETYPVLDPDGLPLSLLREADGIGREDRDRPARRASR